MSFNQVRRTNTSTYPSELGDDDIIVSFEIQLADHYQLVNETLLDFTITFLYSLDREEVFTETIEALMMPGDLPIMDINMTIEDYDIRDVHQGYVITHPKCSHLYEFFSM